MATLHPRMFIPQPTLEAWLESGNVVLEGTQVRLEHLAKTYDLIPAVRFLRAVPEDAAPELIGKVLTERRIAELGGELLGQSVVFGDTAFEVDVGFVGTLREAEPAQAEAT